MNKYSIYNKSSEKMIEIADSSVDMIFTSPPYNIGTKYGEFSDDLSIVEYQELLKKVLSECWRALQPSGQLIIECADSIVFNKEHIQLAGYIQSLCLGLGFKIKERHLNFVNTKDGVELPDHGLAADYKTALNAHSNCHHIIVLSKSPDAKFDAAGKILYINYHPIEGHPCPTPKELIDFILGDYFKENMVVLDPFMGTAATGAEILKRNGSFIGYELDKSIFDIAAANLHSIN